MGCFCQSGAGQREFAGDKSDRASGGVLPCGFVNDLPMAIMFTGGVYDEVSPLRVALAFERATKWHTMHPKMDGHGLSGF